MPIPTSQICGIEEFVHCTRSNQTLFSSMTKMQNKQIFRAPKHTASEFQCHDLSPDPYSAKVHMHGSRVEGMLMDVRLCLLRSLRAEWQGLQTLL